MATDPEPHIPITVTGGQDSETSLKIAGFSVGMSFMGLLCEFDFLHPSTLAGYSFFWGESFLETLPEGVISSDAGTLLFKFFGLALNPVQGTFRYVFVKSFQIY